jgi:hypothetical protein
MTIIEVSTIETTASSHLAIIITTTATIIVAKTLQTLLQIK